MKFSEAVSLLSDAGISDAKREARMLFSRLGGIAPHELIGKDTECDLPRLTDAVHRRAKREPLQYILGSVDFYKERYEVTPDCLIPRYDTEILVDEIIKRLPRGASFLDLCTGSGCIVISVLKNTDGTRAHAVDISRGALECARRNAALNGVDERISFLLLDALSERVEGDFFAVVSNPPYVSEEAYMSLEPEIYHEPREAFVGGESGLVFYEKITEDYKDRIPADGFIAFEIGFDQGEALSEIAAHHGLAAQIIKDYSNNDRVVILTKQNHA